MVAGWSSDETKASLGIWGAADVQSQLDGIAYSRIRGCVHVTTARSLYYVSAVNRTRASRSGLSADAIDVD